MSRRERLERKRERRLDWASSAEGKARGKFEAASDAVRGIEPGQPILVGHHSEKHHRRALERSDARMRSGVELSDKASDHRAKAAGLEEQLDRTIFSDDANAVAALEARIAEREEEAVEQKRINGLYAKGGIEALRAAGIDESRVFTIERFFVLCPYQKRPYPPYSLANLRGNIRRDRERIAEVRRRAEKTERAEAAAGGVLIERFENTYTKQDEARITFAEFPGRAVVAALKAVGFFWRAGSWHGRADRIPALVCELVAEGRDEGIRG